jgi:hypothetical protein
MEILKFISDILIYGPILFIALWAVAKVISSSRRFRRF